MRRMAVIDDCVIVRAMVKFMIPKSDWEVVCYSDPQDLVNDLENGHWDAIITDYNMPGLNGYDLVRMSKRYSPETKVIMIRANRQIPNQHPDILNWVESLLFKPFSRASLVNAIKSIG